MPKDGDSTRERELQELAAKVLPAAGFGNVTHNVIVAEGRGGRVWDIAGREYIDYLLGSGPMLIGHAHPEVSEVVREQAARGTTFFANNEFGIRLAAEIVDAVPCAEKMRFVSTGSEADLYAMRLARAHTGKDKLLKFEGGYHGMSDYGLMSLAPKRAANSDRPIPDSAGIPKSVADEVVVAPYNDLEMATRLIDRYADELAGIIVEPFQRLIPPQPGFLAGLRKLATEKGLVLIFDEVVTGFRFAYGGAQSYYGVTPDVCTLGKAIGGGFPLAAVAGRADLMAHFDRGIVGDDAFLPQIGTLSGNPIAAAAGLKTLEILKRPGAYEKIFATGTALMEGFRRIVGETGTQARVVGAPPMFDLVFTNRDVVDYRSSLGDQDLMKRYTKLMRDRGILKGESKFYISLAHDERDVAETLAAFDATLREMSGS